MQESASSDEQDIGEDGIEYDQDEEEAPPQEDCEVDDEL